MMEFRVQQTPIFGTSSSVKYNGVLTAHVEYSDISEPYNHNKEECRQRRDSTHHRSLASDKHKGHNQRHQLTEHPEQTADGLPFIPARDVQQADGRDGSPSCKPPLPWLALQVLTRGHQGSSSTMLCTMLPALQNGIRADRRHFGVWAANHVHVCVKP